MKALIEQVKEVRFWLGSFLLFFAVFLLPLVQDIRNSHLNLEITQFNISKIERFRLIEDCVAAYTERINLRNFEVSNEDFELLQTVQELFRNECSQYYFGVDVEELKNMGNEYKEILSNKNRETLPWIQFIKWLGSKF